MVVTAPFYSGWGILSGQYLYFKFVVCAFCLVAGIFNAIGGGKYHTHAAVPFDFRLSEDAELHARLLKHFVKIAHLYLSVSPSTTMARDADGP